MWIRSSKLTPIINTQRPVRLRKPSATAPDKNMSLNNPNAEWLNFRGTWVTNVLLVVALKVLFTCVPRMTAEMSWTLTNLTYNIVSLQPSFVNCVSVRSSSSIGFAERHLIRIKVNMVHLPCGSNLTRVHNIRPLANFSSPSPSSCIFMVGGSLTL